MNTTNQTADQYADNVETQAPPAQVSHAHRTGAGFNDPRRKSSFFAALLSIVPGLGQVYVGYYRRGFINVLIMGTVLTIMVSSGPNFPFIPLGIMFLVFFEFYNIIDAARRATLFNLSLEGIEQIDLPDELTNKPLSINGSYIFGFVLMVAGAVALSNTLFDYSLEWINDWWPVAPIGFGLYLVILAYRDNKKGNQESAEEDSE